MRFICADINNYDEQHRLILNCVGTFQDLNRYGIVLEKGMKFIFYLNDAVNKGNPDDLFVEGEVDFDHDLERWVATINWNDFKHRSELSEFDLKELETS